MRARNVSLAVAVAAALAGSWVIALAQAPAPVVDPHPQPKPYKVLTGPQTKNPTAWRYADDYDSVVAAPEVHHIRYEDEHVRLVEVAYFPGVRAKMHGHPWPSVFAVDAPAPKAVNVRLDDNAPLVTRGPAPEGMTFPTCQTMSPQAPHAETNLDTWPHHFYRVEFKRIDGDGIQTNWKTWYPWMLTPLKPIANIDPKDPKYGAPISKAYPYGPGTESYKAAPNNHQLRYEDDHILFLEVTMRPGERENLHGHAYPSVFARDTGASVAAPTPATPLPNPVDHEAGIGHANGQDYKLNPTGVNGQGGGFAGPPGDAKWPTCSTMGPQEPHAASVSNPYPSHFYRIQFKRIDGDGLKDHWREWYPWMAKQADEYKAHPFPLNY